MIPRLRTSSGKPNGPWLVMVDGDGCFSDSAFKIPLKAECAAPGGDKVRLKGELGPLAACVSFELLFSLCVALSLVALANYAVFACTSFGFRIS